MNNKVLEIENLSFGYEAQDVLLDQLSFSVEENEFAVIVGDNGAGKSTLMNLILGNLKPSSGTIRLFSDLNTENNHYNDIAYISQHSVHGYRNFPTTIEEVIRIHLRYLKQKKDVSEVLRIVGLEEHSKKRLNQLSGGQLQRIGLVLALIKDAKLILLDEPTTGIDKKFSLELYKILKRLTKENKTIIMITHHLDEAREYVDKLIRLHDGQCETEILKD